MIWAKSKTFGGGTFHRRMFTTAPEEVRTRSDAARKIRFFMNLKMGTLPVFYLKVIWMMELGHLCVAFMLLLRTCSVDGHGRLWEPPSRSSMWRRGYNTSININDNELSCGGFTNHWIVNRGRCGVCGDPYQHKPRDNEHGGKYASGIIPRTYPVGGTMAVIIGLTANHGGYFEFKLCPLRHGAEIESRECMEKYRLDIINADSGGKRYYIRDHMLEGEVHLTIQLPSGLACQHCVLQWKYRTGSRWGCDSHDMCGQGLGPQEEFYGCADISIADVPKTIYLVPRQPDNHDKVGLNDLGSQHQKKIGGISPMTGYLKPAIQFVVQNITNYSDITKGTSDKGNKQNIPEHMLKYLQDKSYMENLLFRSLMAYYNHRLSDEITKSKTCTAVPEYQTNPIINEWCRNTCPNYPDLCSASICKCVVAHNTQQIINTEYISGGTGDRQKLRSFAKELISKTPSNIPIEKTAPSHEEKQNVNPLVGSKSPLIEHRNTTRSLHGRVIKQTKAPSLAVDEGTQGQHSTKHADTPLDEIPGFKCTASQKFAHNEFMANWCTKNCAFGFCPKSVCMCSY